MDLRRGGPAHLPGRVTMVHGRSVGPVLSIRAVRWRIRVAAGMVGQAPSGAARFVRV
jgi:hypothetical protein